MEKKSSRHQPIQQQGNARGKKTTRKEYGRGKKKYHQQKRSCSRARARALVQPLAILHMNFFIFPFCALYAHRFLYVFLALCLRTIFWPMFCISLLPLLFFAAFFCCFFLHVYRIFFNFAFILPPYSGSLFLPFIG